MLKEMLMKKMLKKQLAGLPDNQQEQIIKAVSENPKFFQEIADDIQIEMKNGKDQMAATMEVMRKHQGELQKLMTK